jgi:hypothetical protein
MSRRRFEMIEKQFADALIPPFLEMHAEGFGALRSSLI